MRRTFARGLASDVKVGDSAFVIGHGGLAHALKTQIIEKREFAGSWEYVLDEALFTAPAHPQWGGAALLDAQGDLIGIGSLLVQQEVNGEAVHANMFVPIDLLDPILDAMLQTGRSPHPPHPWLGMSTQDPEGKLVVEQTLAGRPGRSAPASQVGDMVLRVGALRVTGLAELFRAVWRLGAAGVEVPLTLARGGDVLQHHGQVGRPQLTFSRSRICIDADRRSWPSTRSRSATMRPRTASCCGCPPPTIASSGSGSRAGSPSGCGGCWCRCWNGTGW